MKDKHPREITAVPTHLDSGRLSRSTRIRFVVILFWASSFQFMNPDFFNGLAITKRILELHGRSISVASALNIGTRFRFQLPLHRPA